MKIWSPDEIYLGKLAMDNKKRDEELLVVFYD